MLGSSDKSEEKHADEFGYERNHHFLVEWVKVGFPEEEQNNAEYTAQDAPSTLLKITEDGRKDRRTDGHTLL